MALQRQVIPIPFASGEDTKSDPKQIDAGSVIRLENAQFLKAGQIRKRPGYATVLSTAIAFGGQARYLSAFGSTYVARDGLQLYTGTPTGAPVTGPCPGLDVAKQVVARRAEQILEWQYGRTVAGIECFVWQTEASLSSGAYTTYLVRDAAGSVLGTGQIVSTGTGAAALSMR